VHVVVLVRSDPVVVGYGVVCQIGEQLLQRRVIRGLSIAWIRVVSAGGVDEKYLRIVLGGVVKLIGAIEGIEIAGGKDSGETRQRNRKLAGGQGYIRKLPGAVDRKVGILLVRPPGFSSSGGDKRSQVQVSILDGGSARGRGIRVIVV
jgi:hypothetical protein